MIPPWVLVIHLTLASGHEATLAKGFPSQQSCWEWIRLYNQTRPRAWLGQCMGWRQFATEWPQLRLEEES